MKKKIALIALTLAIAVSTFAGCGNNQNTAETTPTPEVTESPSPENTEEAILTEENVSAENVQTDASEQTSTPSSKPAVETQTKPTVQTPATQTPNVQTPAPAPTVNPTQTPAPTSAPVPSPSVAELMSKMIGSLDKDSHNMSEIPKELYDGVYQVNPSDYDDVLVYGSKMNIKANEIIVIKAKNQSGVDKAKKALSQRLSTLDNQWKHYLPDQYELVKAGKISAKGLYVSLVIAEGGSSAVSAFNSALN